MNDKPVQGRIGSIILKKGVNLLNSFTFLDPKVSNLKIPPYTIQPKTPILLSEKILITLKPESVNFCTNSPFEYRL